MHVDRPRRLGWVCQPTMLADTDRLQRRRQQCMGDFSHWVECCLDQGTMATGRWKIWSRTLGSTGPQYNSSVSMSRRLSQDQQFLDYSRPSPRSGCGQRQRRHPHHDWRRQADIQFGDSPDRGRDWRVVHLDQHRNHCRATNPPNRSHRQPDRRRDRCDRQLVHYPRRGRDGVRRGGRMSLEAISTTIP